MRYLTEKLDKFEYPTEYLDYHLAVFEAAKARDDGAAKDVKEWHATRTAEVRRIREAIANQDTETLESILATYLTNSEYFGTGFTVIITFIAHYLKRIKNSGQENTPKESGPL